MREHLHPPFLTSISFVAGLLLPSPALAGGEIPIERAERIETTSEAASTSSSLPSDATFRFRLGLYSQLPVRSLRLELRWLNQLTDGLECRSLVPGTAKGERLPDEDFFPVARWSFDFGPEGLRQSQRILACSITVFHSEAYWDPEVTILDAEGIDGEPVDVSSAVCLDCGRASSNDFGAPPPSPYDQCGLNLCGDVSGDSSLTAKDSLAILRVAVGSASAVFLQGYDVNRNGSVTADDSLRVLRRGVGGPGFLVCAPPPAADCSWEMGTTTTSLP